ncbi:MAG: site-2 protease family protein [Candidatus Eiseniibacteriota bacterium]|jgi:Zn-dependent protease/CBS domain-containing protein
MRGIRVGSILGLEIRIDYSWFIIFFLILWTLTFGVFPARVPGLSTGTYAAMGIIGTLLFFASLLAHEISHSLVARARGVPVEGITLFVFGGMAHTRMEAESPGDEFAIAGVGPLASIIIAGLFGGIAATTGLIGAGQPVAAVAGYLAFINLAIAVFNLLPGFPLDGGRLFRAAVWRWKHDLRLATRWATAGGKALGYGLIVLGFVQFFAGNLVGGLWLVFIGWFVRTAAEASFAQHVLRSSLEGLRARDVMADQPETVPADMSLHEFVDQWVLRGRHRGYPVMRNGEPVGIVHLDSVKDVPREQWDSRKVADVMAAIDPTSVVAPEESMTQVLGRVGQVDGKRVLVMQDGALRGIITRADLARWIERARLLEGSHR